MKPPKSIKWGIIGLGKIAQKFATDLAVVPNAELCAVASRNLKNANDFAKRHGAQHAYDSYENLVLNAEVDAIYIATPHRFHKEHSLLCLQHKKAVLCEKPFAMNGVEVQEMIAVAQEQDTLLMEALWTRFLPHYKYLLEIIRTEKYGNLTEVKADFGFYTPFNQESRVFQKALGGGSLLDIGIYPIFAALSTLGIPQSIEATATFFDNGADSSCEMIFSYDKAKALLKSSLLEETKSEAVFTFEEAVVTLHTRFHEPTAMTIFSNTHTEELDFDYNTIGYTYEIEHFNQLLREGKTESNLMTFEFSKNLIKLLDQVRAEIGLVY